ncbi:hypothetical protein PMAYCL1PPCAC_05753 [Pristionchus mayeri]|uniref:Uncharacterized protein n=1 Tax=Pristionchus mayeri TaxID=1317129 RepID=A0AAN4Z700_9BILA|nr:hypothetical protein PMAYCL1PPCAC_05753 [Pristionchus mayeri]
MVCFIDPVSLLERKKVKKIVKREERKKERRKERVRKEKEKHGSKKEQKAKTDEVRKEKEKRVEGGEKKGNKDEDEEKTVKKERRRMELTIQLEVDSHLGFTENRRGCLVYRMPPSTTTVDGKKKVIEVIRRERTESEKAVDEIVIHV